MMDKKQLAAYCMSLAGAREDFPFGPDPLVVKLGSKMFALISGEEGRHGLISLKCEPELAHLLRQQHAAVKPGYHLNKQHWNTVVIDGTIDDDDIRGMIDHSYALVRSKLTKAEKQALDLL